MTRRILRSSTAVVAAGVLLSGCWLQVGFDAGHTRASDLEHKLTAANVATLAEAWSVAVVPDATEPIVRGNRVFVATGGVGAGGARSAGAAAFAADSGTTLWNRTYITHCCNGSADIVPAALVGDELWTGWLVVGDVGGRPVGGFEMPLRLDPADGSTIASGDGPAHGTSAVTTGDFVVQNVINLSAPYRQVVVRDRESLAQLWSGEFQAIGSLGPLGAPPAVADGQIFVVERTGLHAYPLAGCGAPTCPETWSYDHGDQLGPPVAAPGGTSVFTTRANDLLAFERASGYLSWTAPLGAAASGLAIADGTVYVAAGTTLFAFSEAGCDVGVCSPTASASLGAAATAAPIVAGGVVYVGEKGAVEAFAQGPGLARLGGVDVGGTTNEMSVAGGRLFVVSRAGTADSQLTAFAPEG